MLLPKFKILNSQHCTHLQTVITNPWKDRCVCFGRSMTFPPLKCSSWLSVTLQNLFQHLFRWSQVDYKGLLNCGAFLKPWQLFSYQEICLLYVSRGKISLLTFFTGKSFLDAMHYLLFHNTFSNKLTLSANYRQLILYYSPSWWYSKALLPVPHQRVPGNIMARFVRLLVPAVCLPIWINCVRCKSFLWCP